MSRACSFAIVLWMTCGLWGCSGPELRLGDKSSATNGGGIGAVGADGGLGTVGAGGKPVKARDAGASRPVTSTGGPDASVMTQPPSSGQGGAFGGAPGSAGTPGVGFPGTAGRPPDLAVKCDSSGTCYYSDGTICYPNGMCCGPMGCPPGSAGVGAPPPVSNEPWVPPVPPDALGAPGWKNSKDPLCLDSGDGNVVSYSIWSDARGVFAATASSSNTVLDPSCPGCPVETIQLNNGTGWTPVAGTPFIGQQQMKGFANGPLLLYGYGGVEMKFGMGNNCGIALLADGTRACEAVDGVSDVGVVDSNLAYAVLQGNVIRYDGKQWGPLPVVFPGQAELQAIWANADIVMATGGSAGKIYSLRSGAWGVEDTRTLDNFSAIWGFSATDVWAGTMQGKLFHYDGSNWNAVSWPGSTCAADPSIHLLWGAGGALFIAGTTTLARWDGSKVDTLAQWSCDQGQGSPNIASLWGNSASEVFIGLLDARSPMQACGSAFVLEYDGKQFHRM